MSSLIIFGFFALISGRRKTTTKTTRNDREIKTYHFHYTTSIQCSNNVSIPADLRIYSSMNDMMLADNTVAFVIAKMFVPCHDIVLMDAFHIAEFPGNPNDDAYQDGIPNLPYPFVVGVGEVVGDEETLDDGTSKVFSVSTSEYVRDTPKHTTIQCYVDKSRPHWENTPIPRTRSVVYFYGTCNFVTSKGLLRIEIEAISLNVGQNVAPTSGLHASLEGTSSKRRKFNAVAATLPSVRWPSSQHASTSKVAESSQEGSSPPDSSTLSTSQSTANDEPNENGTEMVGSAKSWGKRKAKEDM